MTKKQKQIYDYIAGYIAKYGYAPSLSEIRDKVKLNTISTIHGYISRLIKAGLLKRVKGVSRSIELVKNKLANIIEVSLVGYTIKTINNVPNEMGTFQCCGEGGTQSELLFKIQSLI